MLFNSTGDRLILDDPHTYPLLRVYEPIEVGLLVLILSVLMKYDRVLRLTRCLVAHTRHGLYTLASADTNDASAIRQFWDHVWDIQSDLFR